MVVVLTGFEPYGRESYNPSGVVAEKFNGLNIMGEEVVGRVLPVSYKRVPEILENLISSFKPKVILSLGLAPRSPCIRVERVAINIMDSSPDNDGYSPVDEFIVKDGPAAYFSTIPIKAIVKRLLDSGIPAIISNSAGTYLCNYVMYLSLHYMFRFGVSGRAGFIHIPYTIGQVAEKLLGERLEPPASMNFEDIFRAVKLAFEVSLS
ncbi:MAG: pyroglutamyl-peptidase I [Candidatus Methanomethylicia archaeon]